MASDGEDSGSDDRQRGYDEPYSWTPGQLALRSSHSPIHVRSLTDNDATLTLTDDPPGTDHAVDGGNLDWGFRATGSTVTHRNPHASPVDRYWLPVPPYLSH